MKINVSDGISYIEPKSTDLLCAKRAAAASAARSNYSDTIQQYAYERYTLHMHCCNLPVAVPVYKSIRSASVSFIFSYTCNGIAFLLSKN